MKKKISLIFTLLIIVSAGYLILNSQPSPLPQTPPLPTVIPANPQILNRVDIQGVSVNNFIETSKTIEETGEVFAAEKDDYVIIYHKDVEDFLLNVLSSPFESIKLEAEADFLKTLGITKIEACRLNVVIKTPRFANPDQAGKDFGLSFCE